MINEATVAFQEKNSTPKLEILYKNEISLKASSSSPIISGWRQKWIKGLIWLNIFHIALLKFKNPYPAFKNCNKLKQLRDQYRNQHSSTKYSHVDHKYFINYNTPSWPSKAFNRYISHLLNRFSKCPDVSLHTILFAITKKCGFRCEHCCEWENLNKPETLSKEDLLKIVIRFQELGISQVQLSGGEPLNRLDDIIYLLDNAKKGTDFWLYTTGYQLTLKKAWRLKNFGLTGITISLDHHLEDAHDIFRGKKGSFQRALQAAQYANEVGLALCFSLCATKQFINEENLMHYADLVKNSGASFIQILEPKAVGHYANQPVILNTQHHKILESFFIKMNYDPAYSSYPLVMYHGYYSRRSGCSGSGKDYLYIDTDGDAHSCPFCQSKIFSALSDQWIDALETMKTQGCQVYSLNSSIK